MKKITLVLLAALLVFALASCEKVDFDYMNEDLTAYVPTAPAYENLTVIVPAVAPVTDAEVADHAASHLSHAEAPAAQDRACAEGDFVMIDYAGTIDGEAFEGGTAEGTYLELGSGTMIDGFESGIVGMKAGETKTIDVTFPEDYSTEELAGKPAQFAITLHAVYAADDVLAAVRAEMEADRAEEAENNKELYTWSAIVNGATVVAYPEKQVQKLADGLYSNYTMMYAQYISYGLTLENLGVTKESCLAEAQGTYKQELVLYTLVKELGLTVTDEEYEAKVQELVDEQNEYYAEYYGEGYDITVKEFKKSTSRQSVETKVYKDKVLAKAYETATFVEQ